ncbi:unnamed protein product [Tilletia controversa]|uniref:Uncharacterized protein n=1 Tax=Tilletia controversa TaxID=13291 RepID=A0A8X7MZD9_9BASI|nr:hypothetical protein CF328_g3171 [Tilletia controversa]KAE8254406.1 hypothetical protein A4X06_0g922 [Tilletia controversa]CAD6938507.1 unnamed protein product [Tilletia controversa]
MKGVRRSQTLAILAAGNGLNWRRSGSTAAATSSGDPRTGSVFRAILGCPPCFGIDSDSDEEEEDDDEFQQSAPRPTISKPQIVASNSSSSVGTSKSSASVAPSLPPLECETVHITFRRDIVLASPSSWSSSPSAAAKVGAWADLIPTPPERSSSRTSASRPVIRTGSRITRLPYQTIKASSSTSTLNSNFERSSMLPAAIRNASSQDFHLSQTFSPVQCRAMNLHYGGAYSGDSATSKEHLPLRSSALLQASIAASLPSPLEPVRTHGRHFFHNVPDSPSIYDCNTSELDTSWPTMTASAISSTDTLVSLEQRGTSELSTSTSHKSYSKVPLIRGPEFIEGTQTPPMSFSKSFLNIQNNFSPSFTIEAVSAPPSPIFAPYFDMGAFEPITSRSPTTPATFDSFNTSGTPLMDRFPRIETPSSTEPKELDTSLRLLDLCGANPKKSRSEPPQVVVHKPDPAFLSPNWTSPAAQNRTGTADGSGTRLINEAGDSHLSTPRCRMGIVQSSLSSSTNWLLRTAIQASDLEEQDGSTERDGEISPSRKLDLDNFKEALGRLQAAVSIPLTRQSIDGTSMGIKVSITDVDNGRASQEKTGRSPTSPALCNLLRELGMQPLTPPLRSSQQFDAAEVAANWAARCRRSLCKAVHNSGVSPGSMVNFTAPESPERADPSAEEKVPNSEEDEDRTPTQPCAAKMDADSELDSPAQSFNFSICQQTPKLDDFPYTLAMLNSLRQCRTASSFFAPPAPGTVSRLGKEVVSADNLDGVRDSTSLSGVGLGLGSTAFEAQGAMTKGYPGAAARGTDSIFELYGYPPTPRLATTGPLRRSASDASLQTVRSARMSMRRSSLVSATPRIGGSSAQGGMAAYGSGWGWEPQCPPPACPLPPLPSRLSLLAQSSRAIL